MERPDRKSQARNEVHEGGISAGGCSRREAIVMLALGAAAFLKQPGALARSTTSVSKSGRIDVHYHLGGQGGVGGNGANANAGANAGANARPTRTSQWTPSKAIEDMDRVGTAAGIISASSAGAGTGSLEERNRQARQFNETAAKLCTDHPDRFGLWARLPLTDVNASLKEIEYAYGSLKADGIGLVTSYEGMWLGDPKFLPVWQELNRRKAVVYVHPNDDDCCSGPNFLSYEKQNPPVQSAWFEYPMNTARTIFSLLLAGTTRQMPDIRFIFSHGGGVAPLLLSRIEGFVDWDSVGPETLRRLFPDGLQNEFGKLYFEVAQSFSQLNMDALRKLAPPSHILYGSDYPVFPLDHTEIGLQKLTLPATLRRGIERDNALALLPRWRT
jgi:predicted TIM-barrel fold metal-dependent hydrolase